MSLDSEVTAEDCHLILPNVEIKRKTIIEIEMHRRVSLARPLSLPAVHCPLCLMPEQMIAAEHAAEVFNISRRAIYRLIEAGAAHFTESANGEVLPCPASLAALTEK